MSENNNDNNNNHDNDNDVTKHKLDEDDDDYDNDIETKEEPETPIEKEDENEINTAADDDETEREEAKKLNEALAKKSEEYENLYDKYLRVSAEYENFRKRTAKEKEGIYSDAVLDVLKTILPVLDNFERAVQFADTSEPEKVLEGLKMIYSQFSNSLEKLGVEEIKSVGEQFNPEVHNAVLHEEDESQPDNTVTEALQKGYIRGDKVIRAALVKVVN